jgi:uncharacterized protein
MTATGILHGDKAAPFLIGSAEDVANQGFEACLRGGVIGVPGAVNRVTVVVGCVMPKWLLRRVYGAFVRGMR